MSESKSDGGPAFPHMAVDTHRDYRPGMTLLDYFAAAALPECIRVANDKTPEGGNLSELFTKAAGYAYYTAQAMLDARANASDERGE